MRILYLHQYYCPPEGWGNDRSRFFSERWAAQNAEIILLTTTAFFPQNHAARKKFIYQTAPQPNIRLVVFNIAYSQKQTYLRRSLAFLAFLFCGWTYILFSLKQKKKPDLIYASSTPPTVALLGYLASLWYRLPFWFETVDVWPEAPVGMHILKNKSLIWILHTITDFLYQKADRVVVLSEGMRKTVQKRGVLPHKILLAHNGTDPELFYPMELFKETEFKAYPFVVLYTGALGKANDVSFLLEIAKYLQENSHKNLSIIFRLYGDGSEKEALQNKAQLWRLKNVEFYAPIPKSELNAVFNAGDVGVVVFAPYKVLEDNSANKFYDYLAAGLPVLLNYEGWQAEYLRENACGLSAPQGDRPAFMRQLIFLLENETFRRQAAENARKLALERFDRRKIADQLYQTMLTKAARKP